MSISAGETWNPEKHVQTALDATVIIRLWEDRTRGEIYMPLYDTKAVALVNDDYDRSMGDNWNVIDSGKHVFEFRALTPGVHRIVFEKRMGWRFTAEDRRVYILTVTDGNPAAMPDIAFVNGTFVPFADAMVSIDDRGFQFGDGIYEVLRVYGGVPFRPAEHLARLERSARAVDIVLPLDAGQWTDLIMEAVRRSAYHDAKVYIQVTRGVAPRDHSYSASLAPTVVITVRSLLPPADGLYRQGVDVITVTDLRWGRCDIKCTSLLANVLAKQQAVKEGVFEAVFVRDGFVIEGSTSNVMLIHRGGLITPPEGPLLLSGVTRLLALQLAHESGVSTEQRPVKETELYSAEEVFLTGTIIEILPVVRVNARRIGAGSPGPITSQLIARFRKLYA